MLHIWLCLTPHIWLWAMLHISLLQAVVTVPPHALCRGQNRNVWGSFWVPVHTVSTPCLGMGGAVRHHFQRDHMLSGLILANCRS